MRSITKQEEINDNLRRTNIDYELNIQKEIVSEYQLTSSKIRALVNLKRPSYILEILMILYMVRRIGEYVDELYDSVSSILLSDFNLTMYRNYGAMYQLAGLDIPILENIPNMYINPHTNKNIRDSLQEYKSKLFNNLRSTILSPSYKEATPHDRGLLLTRMLYNKIDKGISGDAAKVIRLHRTESTRLRTQIKEQALRELSRYGYANTKQWVYTYESMVPREHHLKSDGLFADKSGYFHIGGLITLGPGLFNLPSEDINCRCDTRVIISESQ